MRKLLAAILAVMMLLGLVSCQKEQEEDPSDTYEIQLPVYTKDDVVLESEHFQFTRAEFSYGFYQTYQSFLTDNQEYMKNNFGFDTTASLKNQSYSEDMSWFDCFTDQTLYYMERILICCEAALDASIELDDADLAQIQAEIQKYETYTDGMGYDLNEWLTGKFGVDASLDAIQSFLEKQMLASKYEDALLDTYSYDTADYDQYLADYPDNFYYINYLAYVFDEDYDENALNAATAAAEIHDSAAFEAYLRTYAAERQNVAEADAEIGDIAYTYAAKDESAFSTWAFGGAAAGDTYIDKNEVDGIYTVYLLTTAPTMEDYPSRNIRFIYLTLRTYYTYSKTLEKGNELLDTWRAAGATDDGFAQLAKEFSEDLNTNANGGLCEYIGKFNSVLPKDLVEWLYAEDTVPGDATVVKGDESYYVAYYQGESDLLQWQYFAKRNLILEQYQADFDQLTEQHQITQHDEVINSLDA